MLPSTDHEVFTYSGGGVYSLLMAHLDGTLCFQLCRLWGRPHLLEASLRRWVRLVLMTAVVAAGLGAGFAAEAGSGSERMYFWCEGHSPKEDLWVFTDGAVSVRGDQGLVYGDVKDRWADYARAMEPDISNTECDWSDDRNYATSKWVERISRVRGWATRPKVRVLSNFSDVLPR